MVKFENMGVMLPVYTTRPHGRDGVTGSYSASLWMTMLAGFLIWLNIIVWGVLGLYEAVRVVF